MSIEVGTVYEGKVTGITGFGAFVQLPGGKSGMVHISEIANTYVDDISKHLQEGQAVKVRVIGIDQQNRINLSIKKAIEGADSAQSAPRPQQQRPQGGPGGGGGPGGPRPQSNGPRPPRQSTLVKTDDDSFEGKLKAFMQNSESRMSDIKSQRESRGGGGGKRRK